MLLKKLETLRGERGRLCLYRVEAKKDKRSETREVEEEAGFTEGQ